MTNDGGNQIIDEELDSQLVTEFNGLITDLGDDRRTKVQNFFQELNIDSKQSALTAYKFFTEKGFSLATPIDDDIETYVKEVLVQWGLNDWTMEYLHTFSEEDINYIFNEGVVVIATKAEELIERQSKFQGILNRINYITPSNEPHHFKNAAEVALAIEQGILKGVEMQSVDGVKNEDESPIYFVQPELAAAMAMLDEKLQERNLGGYLRISSGVRNLEIQDLFYKLGYPAIIGQSFHTQGNALDFPLSVRERDGKSYHETFKEEIGEKGLEVVNQHLMQGETITIENLAKWGVISNEHPLMQILDVLKGLESIGIQFLDETYFVSIDTENPYQIPDVDNAQPIYLSKGVKPLLHVQFNPKVKQPEN